MLRRRVALAGAVALVATAFAIEPAGAAPPPGSLDPRFGTGGAVMADLNGHGSWDAVADAAVQPDGRTVVTGTSGPDYNRSVLVARYRRDGTLDPTFGGDGVVTTDVSSAPDAWEDSDSGAAIALQSDGKILVAGYTYDANDEAGLRGALVVRYLPDGTLDPTFGDDGIVVTGGVGLSSDIAVLASGHILVAGGGGDRLFVARYQPDGGLDPAFGTGGMVRPDTGTPVAATALAVQPNGRIVVSATADGGGGNPRPPTDIAVLRLLRTGAPDTGFGTGGMVTTDLGSPYDVASSVALQPDGRIVVAGSSGPTNTHGDFALARFRRDGTLDRSFGTGGVVRTAFAEVPGQADDSARDLLVQADGRILVTGPANQTEERGCGCLGEQSDIGLVRYRSDGSLDPTFGTGGRVVTDLGRVEAPVVLAPYPGNRVVVAGPVAEPTSTSSDSFVARYRVGPGLR